MIAAFFAAVEKHKAGDSRDMDIAVYGTSGYSFVGFLIVRCGCVLVGEAKRDCGAVHFSTARTKCDCCYMVSCSYLVEYCGLGLDAALSEYASAAPPGVYTQHYLEVRRVVFSVLS